MTMSVWAFSDKINQEKKTHSEHGWHHLITWGPGWNQREIKRKATVGELNENGFHRLTCWNNWSPVG